MQRFFCASVRHLIPLCLTIVIIGGAMMALCPAPREDHRGRQYVEEIEQLGRMVRQLQEENGLLRKRLADSEANAERLSRLDRIQEEAKREGVIVLRENVVTLVKKVKELELLNTNLNNKQEHLEAAVQKLQQQFNECEKNIVTTDGHLKRTGQELNRCQRDKAQCRTRMEQCSHASTVHGAHASWIVLSVVCLKLLYG